MMELRADLRNFFGSNDVFENILNAEGRVFREHKNRKTVYVVKDGKGYFIKIHRGIGWKEIFKNLLSLRWPVLSAGNELCAIRRLEEIGIETAKVAGFGERGMRPAWLESFLITDDLVNTISLEDFSRDWRSHPPDFTMKSAIIERVAGIARLLHRSGINHRDFYICHFLLDTSGLNKNDDYEGLHIYLIDLHRMQMRERTPLRWRIKDLSGLLFSSMNIGLTKRDIFRFMKAYSGKPLRNTLTEDASLWSQVFRRSVKLYERHFGRRPDVPFF
ncbi:MAG: lipopolysaccharide core heptose(I) kinase RfaP [Nitrospirota bacterium]